MSIDNKQKKKTKCRKFAKTAVTVLCALLLVLAMTGCGEENTDKDKASGANGEESGAAKKYVDLLTSEDSTYYMEISTESKTEEGEKNIVEDYQVLAQDKGKKFMSSELNGTKQYVKDGKLYYCLDNTMTYYVTPQNDSQSEVTDAYAPNSGYKKTVDKEFGGEKCKCDIYEKETTEEGTSLVNVTEYYVDKEGNLVGVMSVQKNADRNMEEVSKVKMKVEKFTTKIPEGTFDLPKGYEEVKQ